MPRQPAYGKKRIGPRVSSFAQEAADAQFPEYANIQNKPATFPPSAHTHPISDITNLAAGVYAPTRSAEVNLDANITPSEAQYLRVGNTVTVSGQFTADPTLAATPTSFELTLPVASNIGAVEDAAGVAFCGAIAGMGAAVSGSVANNTAVVSWISSDITSQTWSYMFTYQVI